MRTGSMEWIVAPAAVSERPALRGLTPWPPLHFVERGNLSSRSCRAQTIPSYAGPPSPRSGEGPRVRLLRAGSCEFRAACRAVVSGHPREHAVAARVLGRVQGAVGGGDQVAGGDLARGPAGGLLQGGEADRDRD